MCVFGGWGFLYCGKEKSWRRVQEGEWRWWWSQVLSWAGEGNSCPGASYSLRVTSFGGGGWAGKKFKEDFQLYEKRGKAKIASAWVLQQSLQRQPHSVERVASPSSFLGTTLSISRHSTELCLSSCTSFQLILCICYQDMSSVNCFFT